MDLEVWNLFKTSCTKFLSRGNELVVLVLVEMKSGGVWVDDRPLIGPMKAKGMSLGCQISDNVLTVGSRKTPN